MNGLPNQPQSNWPDNQPKIGTGEGESPLAPPPPQKTEMRTMNSDLQSVQESGGQGARSYEPVFQPPQVETPPLPTTPSGPVDGPPAMMPAAEPEKRKSKGLWLTLIVMIIVIGLAAVGYFFVYPALFPTGETTEETTPPPVQTPPPAEEPPIVPPAQEPPPAPTGGAPEAPSADTLPTISSHVSLFKTAADATLDVAPATASLESLRSAIPSSNISGNGFYEIVIKNSLSQPISFTGLMPLLMPEFFNIQTLGYFEEDATFFVYTANGSSRLGYVAKLKSATDVGQAQDRMSALQKDANNKNLFLADPGEQGVWRDGQIAGKPASVVDFSQTGATLGYVWLEKNLLITTNLAGGEEAARRLGF